MHVFYRTGRVVSPAHSTGPIFGCTISAAIFPCLLLPPSPPLHILYVYVYVTYTQTTPYTLHSIHAHDRTPFFRVLGFWSGGVPLGPRPSRCRCERTCWKRNQQAYQTTSQPPTQQHYTHNIYNTHTHTHTTTTVTHTNTLLTRTAVLSGWVPPGLRPSGRRSGTTY